MFLANNVDLALDPYDFPVNALATCLPYQIWRHVEIPAVWWWGRTWTCLHSWWTLTFGYFASVIWKSLKSRRSINGAGACRQVWWYNRSRPWPVCNLIHQHQKNGIQYHTKHNTRKNRKYSITNHNKYSVMFFCEIRCSSLPFAAEEWAPKQDPSSIQYSQASIRGEVFRNEDCVAMAEGLTESIFQIGYPAPMCEGNWSRSSCKPFAALRAPNPVSALKYHTFSHWVAATWVSSPPRSSHRNLFQCPCPYSWCTYLPEANFIVGSVGGSANDVATSLGTKDQSACRCGSIIKGHRRERSIMMAFLSWSDL